MKIKISIIFVAFILNSCLPKFEDPVLPSWDTELFFPLMDTSFTISDILKKDTTGAVQIDDSNRIFYKYSTQSKPTTVGDKLQIHPDSTDPIMLQIGEFQIQTPQATSLNVKIIDSIPSPIPTSIHLQSIDTNFTVSIFENIDEFEFVKFSSGTISFSIKNNLPIAIKSINIRIFNTNNSNETIAEFPSSTFNTILPNEIKTSTFNLSQSDTMRNALNLFAQIETDTGTIQIPMGSKSITFGFDIQNAKATSARAKIPQQTVSGINGTIPFVADDSTFIKQIVFKSGKLYFEINNKIDLKISLKLQLDAFRKISNNEPLLLQPIIPNLNDPITHGKISIPIDLSEYKIDFSDNGRNEFVYIAEISNVDSANSYRTINSGDFISTFIAVPKDTAFKLKYIEGKIKPFSQTVSETLNVNLTDVDTSFNGTIRFAGFYVDLGLHISGGAKTILEMQIKGRNTTTNIENTDTITMTIFPNQLNKVRIPLDDFLSAFSYPNLPNQIIFSGNAKFNTDYEVVSISDTSSVYGTTDFIIPFKVGITNGEFSTAAKIKTKFDASNLENINNASLKFNFENGIPLQFLSTIKFTGNDTINNFEKEFSIDSSLASQNLPNKFTTQLGMTGEEMQKLSQCDSVKIILQMNTSGNSIIQFRSTDKIKVRISAYMNYNVNDGNQNKIVYKREEDGK